MSYWIQALFWSWVGAIAWPGLATLVGGYMGRRDAEAVRRRLQERGSHDWLDG